jgi:hypothetical protein
MILSLLRLDRNIGPVLRRFTTLLLPLLLSLSLPARAAGIDDVTPDPAFIAQLEQRAEQAKPKEQCFLYTELVHEMTLLAGKQLRDGDIDHASLTLKSVEHYAQLIHLGLANDTKRLKNAEMLMHHTTHKLGEYLHAASGDDRPVLEATLKHLDAIQDELLTQVFNH